MATNEILKFAGTDTGTNLLSQAAYAADAQRAIGNQPGIARAALVNKAMRQASAVVAGLAQFIADNQTSDVTDSLTEAQLADAFVSALQAQANPVGSLKIGLTVLDGFLEMNGALLTRSTYPELFAYASDNSLLVTEAVWTAGRFGMFSDGDTATTFRLPDFRGYTIRGLDNGRGVDSGRLIGQSQLDAIQNITGSLGFDAWAITASGPFSVTGTNPVGASTAGTLGTTIDFDASRVVRTATETRMKNVPIIFNIKY